MAYQNAPPAAYGFTVTSVPVTTTPYTIATTAQFTSLTVDSETFRIRNDANDNTNILVLRGTSTGDPLEFNARTATQTATLAQSTAAYSITTWNYCAGVASAANSRTVYLNGGNNATNTGTRTPSGWTSMSFAQSTATQTAQIAEVAIWDVALTVDEVVSLAKGFKPFRIRPQSLVFYSPFIRNLQDLSGALTISNTNNATVSVHPRVY